VRTGIYIISALKKLYPEKIKFSRGTAMFNKALGTEKVILFLKAGIPPARIILRWQNDLKKFRKIRRKYLLYD